MVLVDITGYQLTVYDGMDMTNMAFEKILKIIKLSNDKSGWCLCLSVFIYVSVYECLILLLLLLLLILLLL
jgi:hypothetical protein